MKYKQTCRTATNVLCTAKSGRIYLGKFQFMGGGGGAVKRTFLKVFCPVRDADTVWNTVLLW